MHLSQFGLGFGLAGLIAFGANRAGALSTSGAWAALIVGGLTFSFGGLWAALLLMVFFVSSSALSRFGGARKQQLAEKFAKGSRRDAAQVAANGGLASLLVVLWRLAPSQLWLAAFVGAVAAVTADTWATELGVLARSQPRRLRDWSQVSPGTSGAITIEGTLASAGGAALIGTAAALLTGVPTLVLVGLLGGIAGAMADSILGSSFQARYYCPYCDKETERSPLHSCGHETQFEGGWRWLNNDAVNAAASITGAAIAMLFAWMA